MSGRKISVEPTFTGENREWFFNGDPAWRESGNGVIYSPKWWDRKVFPEDSRKSPDYYQNITENKSLPFYYASPTARVDYAFYKNESFDDLDMSVQYKMLMDTVSYGGVVFRAQDEVRGYVLGIKKLNYTPHYVCTLWLQDQYGIRYELAEAEVPHSLTSNLKMHPHDYETWMESAPEWITIRIQMIGAFIRISVDDRIIIEKRDDTYTGGFAGLFGMGFLSFRELSLKGTAAELKWSGKHEEYPPFFYPGHHQPYGFNSFPMCLHTRSGVTLTGWTHGHMNETGERIGQLLITRSTDNAESWEEPYPIIEAEIEQDALPPFSFISFFEHNNGELTAIIHEYGSYNVYRSGDTGKSWKKIEEFDTNGGNLYSGMIRTSDGDVVITGYYARTNGKDGSGDDFTREDNSIIYRSRDDGYTWDPPYCIDETNHDHNECMLAEGEPGHFVAFMRPLLASGMWTSHSKDYGKTWTPVVQSGMGGSSTWMIRHSSGVLVMFVRNNGAYIRLSHDQGYTWSTPIFISSCCPMVGMCELSDKKILIVMFEGYRVPGYIRGLKFSVEDGRVIPASDMPEREDHRQY